MKVERFFHLRAFSHKGGATVLVTGDPDNVGLVEVQVSRCSKKDPFCKKIGRVLAMGAPIKIVPLRYLPNELARLQAAVSEYIPDFNYAVRYFLPKE